MRCVCVLIASESLGEVGRKHSLLTSSFLHAVQPTVILNNNKKMNKERETMVRV